MPLDPSTAAAISNTIDNASSIIATNNVNRKTRKWNEKIMAQQREWALQDWEMQNAYNSPAEQMKRLQAAGLNPHLVYGNGADATANQMPRSTDAPQWRPEAPHINTMPGLMAGYDIEAKMAQTDNIRQLTEVAKEEQVLKAVQAWAAIVGVGKTKADTKLSEFELGQKERLSDLVVHQAEANLNKTQTETMLSIKANDRAEALQQPTIAKILQDIQASRSMVSLNQHQINKIDQEIGNLRKDNELKQLDINLKKAGIQPSDPAWMRVIIQALTQGRVAPQQSPEIQAIDDSLKRKHNIGKYRK